MPKVLTIVMSSLEIVCAVSAIIAQVKKLDDIKQNKLTTS